jgi:hypothetical protein
MADLLMRLLPGRASMMLWAFFSGFSAGTLLALRTAATEREGRARLARVGRRRGAPAWG